MSKLKFAFGSVGLGLACIVLAADPDISKLPPPAEKPGLTYEKDIKSMLENSCVTCHSGEKPKSKYSMETREATLKGGSSDEAAVLPGNSAKSPIVLYSAGLVEDMEMPPVDKRDKYPALTKEQLGILRAWVDQGAK